MQWIIYILKCKDQSLYTGITNDLDKRVAKHISGNGSKYLRGRLPVKLVYEEIALNRSDATKRELEIKKLNKEEKQFLIETYNKKIYEDKMSKSKYIFVVSMNVKREHENLFNEVYDEEHIPYLLKVPGVNKVTRGRGVPFSFSIGGETKSMNAPLQKFIAMYEIDSPDVVESQEWSLAVEQGRWSTQVRQHTSERSHFMYEYCYC
jgi:predicted GIY-YIG superfamily endonuclease